MAASKALLQAIAVTAELTQTSLSTAAARVMAEDLARYPEAQVLAALTRCRRELKGRLTIADVLTRLDDGRPGVEEAWARVPKTEAESAAWTDEMAQAFGVAWPLLSDDPIAARMAFKEAYTAAVQRARDAGRSPRWTFTLGHDVNGREPVIQAALKAGLISLDYAQRLLPNIAASPGALAALGCEVKLKKVGA